MNGSLERIAPVRFPRILIGAVARILSGTHAEIVSREFHPFCAAFALGSQILPEGFEFRGKRTGLDLRASEESTPIPEQLQVDCPQILVDRPQLELANG